MNMKWKVIFVFSLMIGVILGIYLRKIKYSVSVSKPVSEYTLKLNWRHEAEFAGVYAGIEKGFYGNEGIKLKVEEYSVNGDNAIDSLVAGKADFAIAGADEILLAREAGKPIKAVSVIYKTNPAVAFSLKSSGIVKPTDFVGKTVGLEEGINVNYLYKAMMNKLGIDQKKIKTVVIGYDAKELMSGQVDVSTGWITNEPQIAVEAGYPVNIFLMAEYGVNIYADTLVTTEKMIAEKPAVVKSFVKATLQGWQYAFENESEAVDITMNYVSGTTRKHQAYVLSTSIPLINTGVSKLGWMEMADWENAQKILYEQKILSQKNRVNEAFTMQFLEEIYK